MSLTQLNHCDFCDEMVKRYPVLYGNHTLFEIGNGWYDLVDAMSQQLVSNIPKNMGELEAYVPLVSLMKSKYARLSVFAIGTADSDQFFDTIEQFEELSTKCCELCGEAGELIRNNGWWWTVCSIHHASLPSCQPPV